MSVRSPNAAATTGRSASSISTGGAGSISTTLVRGSPESASASSAVASAANTATTWGSSRLPAKRPSALVTVSASPSAAKNTASVATRAIRAAGAISSPLSPRAPRPFHHSWTSNSAALTASGSPMRRATARAASQLAMSCRFENAWPLAASNATLLTRAAAGNPRVASGINTETTSQAVFVRTTAR